MRRRTRAREIALQFLYGFEASAAQPRPTADAFLREQTDDDAVYSFALDAVNGCLENQAEIDEEIRAVARNWNLERLASIDRNVVRIGVYELLFRDDIPPQVTINEAIELAKRYSTEKSGAFVNGILDRIRERNDGKPPRPRKQADDVMVTSLAPQPEGETDETTDDGGTFPPLPPLA
jgi:transcription antitermination factor NusB